MRGVPARCVQANGDPPQRCADGDAKALYAPGAFWDHSHFYHHQPVTTLQTNRWPPPW